MPHFKPIYSDFNVFNVFRFLLLLLLLLFLLVEIAPIRWRCYFGWHWHSVRMRERVRADKCLFVSIWLALRWNTNGNHEWPSHFLVVVIFMYIYDSIKNAFKSFSSPWYLDRFPFEAHTATWNNNRIVYTTFYNTDESFSCDKKGLERFFISRRGYNIQINDFCSFVTSVYWIVVVFFSLRRHYVCCCFLIWSAIHIHTQPHTHKQGSQRDLISKWFEKCLIQLDQC